jgi:signal transduction histidine kinase
VDERLAVVAHQVSEGSAQTIITNGTASSTGTDLVDRTSSSGIVATRITPDNQSHLLPVCLSVAAIPDDPTLTAAARAGRAASGTVQLRSDERMRLFAMPVGNGQPTGEVLVVGQSLQGMQRILLDAGAILLLAGALTAGLITGGVWLVMRPRLTTLSRLTRLTADVVASRDYRTRMALPARRDDIHQLSVTINALISTVQRTLDQQRQFLAFTEHELRSPLTVILANLDLLHRDLTPQERTLCVTEATAEARRMRQLVNDLLLLAEKDSTRVVARIPLRLDSLIEETVAVIIHQDKTHSVHVDVEAPVVVEGDAERLTQVVRNLVENALMHTPAGTQVEVRLAQVDGCAQLTVADNGPGIAPEHLPYLWDRFYRVDKARSRVKDSTGLGLPIVEYIAEAHDGSATVTSTLGQGTTFTVLLPLAT